MFSAITVDSGILQEERCSHIFYIPSLKLPSELPSCTLHCSHTAVHHHNNFFFSSYKSSTLLALPLLINSFLWKEVIGKMYWSRYSMPAVSTIKESITCSDYTPKQPNSICTQLMLRLLKHKTCHHGKYRKFSELTGLKKYEGKKLFNICLTFLIKTFYC